MSHHMKEEDERTLQMERQGKCWAQSRVEAFSFCLAVLCCRTHLKTIEKEEDPCKDGGVRTDSQQSNHPGESQDGKENHHCFHQGTL